MGLFNWWSNRWENKIEEDFNKAIEQEVESITLDCEGYYKLLVRENSGYGMNGYENGYLIHAQYSVEVTVEDELTSYHFTGLVNVRTEKREIDAYQKAIDLPESLREEVLSSMKKDIYDRFYWHVKNQNIKDLKAKLDENKEITINFKTVVDKP